MSGNGNLSLAELAPAAGGFPGSDPGCGHLANDSARRWNAMAAEIYRETGVRIGCNGPDSMYRSLARQWYWRNYWCSRGACGNAAWPGSSNHGWGRAIDNGFRALIAKYGASYGYRWECSDAPWESWHLKDCGGGSYGGPDPGPDYSSGGGGGGGEPTYPTLRKGDKGGAVERLQRNLREWNLGVARPDQADGVFGERTADAVRDFQAIHGLHEDAVVGKNTWAKLRRRVVLTDTELAHVNRLRLLERGENVTDREREKIRAHRRWLARRRDWMRRKPERWWDNRRHQRFRVIKREAGDA